MDADDSIPATPINPNNFPAKLWRLVNSPRYQSICWDSRGEGIIIDQQLFESELLCASKSMSENNELFKTSNFTSFIRQLNLYGFRKVMMGAGNNAGHLHPGGDLGVGDGQLHHFHNVHFRKEHPGMLVNLKRLTSTNKAKLAAGLEVNTRPPNRFQRLLTNSLEQSKGEKQGHVSLGQIHRSLQQENLSSYPYASPSHSHIGFPLKGLDRTPIPPRTWSNPMGLLPGQVEASSFREKGFLFPVLQMLPTEVTYTLQPSPTAVHVQQGPTSISGAMQKFGGYAPPAAQYSQAYYPTAPLYHSNFLCFLLCCSSPAHMEHLTGCPNPVVSSYQHCSYFQSPPMQSSFPMDFLPPLWPSGDCEGTKKDEVNLEAVFQIVDELHSSPKLEMVKVETQENQAESSSSSPPRKHHAPLTVTSENVGDCFSHTNQLESLTPVNTDITSYVTAADQSTPSPLPQPSEYIYPSRKIQKDSSNGFSPTCNVLDINVKLEKDENQSKLAVAPVDQGLSPIPLKVAVNSPSSLLPGQKQNLESEPTSADSVAKEEVISQNRENRETSKPDKSPDLTLLVDVACKQEQFPKWGELGEQA
ncbi:heat shock factor protein 5 [Pelodytes ibericus]